MFAFFVLITFLSKTSIWLMTGWPNVKGCCVLTLPTYCTLDKTSHQVNQIVALAVNPFIHVEKWPDILQKSCGVHIARILKYIWPLFNIMNERVKVMKDLK